MKRFFARILPKLYGTYFNLYALFSPLSTGRKAFTFFCTVRKGRVLPKQADYLEQAKHTKIEIAGHHIQTYRWPGMGDTVLLVHGWESNSFRWRNLIAKLKEKDYTVIAFDAPAHGHSTGKMLYVPLYGNCLNHIIKTYAPQYLIGHSVGGMTALYTQYKYPMDSVEKIVTLGSPSEFYEILDRYQEVLGFNNRVKGAFEAYVLQRFGMGVNDFSSSKFVENNTKKGLLIHDEEDLLAPFHASEKVHIAWKGSRFIRTQGLGHSLHQEHINDQIIEFLGEAT
ncbi:MAG: alpha/beta hydrolase [Bacteroidota bacterium]